MVAICTSAREVVERRRLYALRQERTYALQQPMSAKGQKRTHAVQNGMSALPPMATGKSGHPVPGSQRGNSLALIQCSRHDKEDRHQQKHC